MEYFSQSDSALSEHTSSNTLFQPNWKNLTGCALGQKSTFSYPFERLTKSGWVTSFQNVTVHIRSDKTHWEKSLRVLSELDTLHFLAKLLTPQPTEAQTGWIRLLWRPTQQQLQERAGLRLRSGRRWVSSTSLVETSLCRLKVSIGRHELYRRSCVR